MRSAQIEPPQITGNMSVAEIIRLCPNARRIFDQHGLKGCGGEHGPAEPLSFFATVHQADLNTLLNELNEEAKRPSPAPYVYKEALEDYIYRRFFKAGIAIVLSVGALWGAVNLLQIALGMSFLQLNLLPSIHAHAHAMIFGWVGLFVMGFAYQSFPRFKNTTLWRPDLANRSFYMMLAGIVAFMAAEILLPHPVALSLADAARVTLQILTDFVPHVAYPLIGFTGFIEVVALTWWGIELWRTMNQARTERPKVFAAPFPIATR